MTSSKLPKEKQTAPCQARGGFCVALLKQLLSHLVPLPSENPGKL